MVPRSERLRRIPPIRSPCNQYNISIIIMLKMFNVHVCVENSLCYFSLSTFFSIDFGNDPKPTPNTQSISNNHIDDYQTKLFFFFSSLFGCRRVRFFYFLCVTMFKLQPKRGPKNVILISIYFLFSLLNSDQVFVRLISCNK